MNAPFRYLVIDLKDGCVMARYCDAKPARRRAEKLDLAYGAYRYAVREIKS